MGASQTLVGCTTAAVPRTRAHHPLSSADVPMARASVVCQLALVVLTAPLYEALNLSFAWETAVPHVLFLTMLAAV
jgi:hypothetical protein